MTFENFDFSLLDDPEFKEDSVREEIIVPILRRLGYAASGPARIVRSKALIHPLVYIGSRPHPVNVVPDYLLIVGDAHKWILDAKSPKESILSGKNPEQAFSYAIHPEVRAFRYALCNGRQLAVFDVQKINPLLVLDVQQFDEKIAAVERLLSPLAFTKPHIFDFKPDLGLYLLKAGARVDSRMHFVGVGIPMVAKVEDGRYTTFMTVGGEGDFYGVSFDFDDDKLHQLLAALDEQNRLKASEGLKRQPYKVFFDIPSEVCIEATFGQVVHENEDESYCPFEAVTFSRIDDKSTP